MHLLQSWSFIPKRMIKMIVPVFTVFLLSLGLTFTFVLYHLPRPRLQRLAWQKWDLASTAGGFKNSTSDLPSAGAGKEWWELPEMDAGDAPAGTSLPLDVWSPLLPHATGRELKDPYPAYTKSTINCVSDRNCHPFLHRQSQPGRLLRS